MWGSYGLWNHSGDEIEEKSLRESALSILSSSEYEYPQRPVCVFCQRDLTGKAWDWYDHREFSNGPGCWGRSVFDEHCPQEKEAIA
ncbi:MAG: hypothetical protein AAGA67_02105 [Cyanobacteria bacterium P01_F01_bin.153]